MLKQLVDQLQIFKTCCFSLSHIIVNLILLVFELLVGQKQFEGYSLGSFLTVFWLLSNWTINWWIWKLINRSAVIENNYYLQTRGLQRTYKFLQSKSWLGTWLGSGPNHIQSNGVEPRLIPLGLGSVCQYVSCPNGYVLSLSALIMWCVKIIIGQRWKVSTFKCSKR